MKKLKLIPGLILLALCVAVLGVGIYAAAPASNTITGTVTVTAANPEVEVSVYQDDYNPASASTNRQSTGTTRTGLDLSMGSFTFDASSANTKYDVPLKEIIIVVKNHSTQDLGMYFWKSTAEGGDSTLNVNTTNNDPEKGCVLVSDVLYGHHKYASTNSVADVIDVEYEFYKHLPKAVDANTNGTIEASEYGTETIRMYVRLDKLVEDDVTVNLNVNLNIEKYVSNYSSSKTGFVKVGTADLTSGTTMPTTYANGLTHLTLPYGTTAITNHFVEAENPWDDDEYLSWLGETSLTAIGIPSSVTTIQYNSLAEGGDEDWHIASLIIPDSVTTLESWHYAIRSIVIPKGVTSIDAWNLGNGFERISVNSSNTKYKSPDNCNALITKVSVNDEPANTLIVGCGNSTIPNTVTKIGYSAFSGCSNLYSITIPSSVTIIDGGAFNDCWNLSSITFEPCSTSLTIESAAFEGCTDLEEAILPSGLTSIGDSAFQSCSSLALVYIPSSVITIDASLEGNEVWVFYECDSGLVINCGAASKPNGWGEYWDCIDGYSGNEVRATVNWNVPQP